MAATIVCAGLALAILLPSSSQDQSRFAGDTGNQRSSSSGQSTRSRYSEFSSDYSRSKYSGSQSDKSNSASDSLQNELAETTATKTQYQNEGLIAGTAIYTSDSFTSEVGGELIDPFAEVSQPDTSSEAPTQPMMPEEQTNAELPIQSETETVQTENTTDGIESAAQHGVYVPVTVNIDGTSLSGEFNRFADRLELLLEQKSGNEPRKPGRQRRENRSNKLKETESVSATNPPDDVDHTKAVLSHIDSTVAGLIQTVETLQSDTQDAVRKLNQRMEYEQASLKLLEEYRSALERERTAGRAFISESPLAVPATVQGSEELPKTADAHETQLPNVIQQNHEPETTSDSLAPPVLTGSLTTSGPADNTLLQPIPDTLLNAASDSSSGDSCAAEPTPEQPAQPVPEVPNDFTLSMPFEPLPVNEVSWPQSNTAADDVQVDEEDEQDLGTHQQTEHRQIVEPVMFRHTYRFPVEVTETAPETQISTQKSVQNNHRHHHSTQHGQHQLPPNVRRTDVSKLNPLQRGMRAVRNSRWVPDIDFDTPHWIEKLPDSRPVKAVRESQWLHRLSSTIRKSPSSRTVD